MNRKNSARTARNTWTVIVAAGVVGLVLLGPSAGPGGRRAMGGGEKQQTFEGNVDVRGTLTARAVRLSDGSTPATRKQLEAVKAEILKSTMDNLTKQLKTRSSSWDVANFADEISKKVAAELADNLRSGSSSGAAGQLRRQLTALVQAELKKRGLLASASSSSSSSSASRANAAELARLKRALDDLERKHKAALRKLDDLEDEVEELRRDVKRR